MLSEKELRSTFTSWYFQPGAIYKLKDTVAWISLEKDTAGIAMLEMGLCQHV